MDDNIPVEEKLKRVVSALESEDWAWAVDELRSSDLSVSAAELVSDPFTAVTIARAAWVAPYQCLVEIQILLWDSEGDAYLATDPARVPTVIADMLFDAAERRFRQVADEEAWDDVPRYAELLLELPGATDRREQVLLDVFAVLIDRANAVSSAIALQGRRQPRAAEREQFVAIWSVIGLAAQSSTYDLTTSLLIGLLRGAEGPIFRACSAASVILLWPELVAIWELRQKHNLRETSEEWLRRIIREDEPDEHAATELDEP